MIQVKNLIYKLYPHLCRKVISFVILIITLQFPISFSGCSRSEQIPVELEQQLKTSGVNELNLDFAYQSPDIPNKKYQAISITYNFATADGTPQKEYRGFILKLENGQWKVDRNAGYTTESERAKNLLEGKK